MAKRVISAPTPLMQHALDSILLGQYVHARRTQLGLTLEMAAGLCGVAKDTLMKLEKGQPKVQLGTALKICQQLGITINIQPWDKDEHNVWF